jgi:hypothetical protein
MPYPRTIRWMILAIGLTAFVAEVRALAKGQLSLGEGGWFPLLLISLAVMILLYRREIQAVGVLSLLLTFLSAAWFDTPDWLSSLAILLCAFLFVHFSLTFPVPNGWIDRNPKRLVLVYLPWLALSIPYLRWIFWGQISDFWNFPLFFVIAAGFALGLSIFVYQYLFSLTGSERNRLQVILIGCLAGLVPFFLSSLAARSSDWRSLAFFLLPLFPASLVFAVLRENFYEIGRTFQRILVYTLVSAGALSVFFLSYVALPAFFAADSATDTKKVLAAALLSLIVIYPFQRWAWAYTASRFHRASRRRTGNGPLPQFRPIEPNPYIVGNPVRSPEMFFGRKEDFHFIRARLQGQHEGSVILLYGERRAGKTSILHQIVNGRLGSRFVPVFVDMQGMVVQNDAELLQALAAIVVEAVAAAGNNAGRHHPESVAGYRDFTALLDDIMRGIEDRQLVILFDEYELIEHKVSQGKISAEIYDYLTSLLERYPHRLSLLFTGSRSFGVSHAWHSLMGKSVARKISFLSAGDAEDLICRPLGDRIVVGPEAIGDLLRLTRGQPFFTQLLCQMMVEVLNEQRMNCVDRNVVRQVLARALENPPPQLIYQWNNLPGPEKLLLAALAALLKSPASYASWGSVDRSIQSLPSEYRQGLDAPRNRMLLEGLRLDDILDRDQTRYRFTMDLMRHWIQAEHNVWNVLNEIKQAPTCSAALPGFDPR